MNELSLKPQDKDTLLKPLENIIHDMKIPLTIMYTKIQILEETQDISEEVADTLFVIKRNWFRVMKLLNDISDHKKILNGEITLKFENLDIIKILSNITKTASSLAYKKQIDLKFETDIKCKIMAVDKEVLERIMLNLISNSIKYCGQGSLVRISVYQNFDNLIISVKDNGKGIEKSKLDLLFKRRVVSYNEKNIPTGSGIGLSIVKEFVDLLNGEIALNTGKKGTEIAIKLPVFMAESNYNKMPLDDFYSYNIYEFELSDDYNID